MLLAGLIASVIVLIYSAMAVDLNRKCKDAPGVNKGTNTMMSYVNILMLIASSLSLLYAAFHLFATDSHKAKVASYF